MQSTAPQPITMPQPRRGSVARRPRPAEVVDLPKPKPEAVTVVELLNAVYTMQEYFAFAAAAAAMTKEARRMRKYAKTTAADLAKRLRAGAEITSDECVYRMVK